MSTSFSDFMLEMEQEARAAGPEVAAAFFESQQRHWIGRLLFERRREQGLTQAKLAAISGVDQGDISKIEHAEANPTLETLTALTSALGCMLALQPIAAETRVLMQAKRGGSRPSRDGSALQRQPRRGALEPAAAWMARTASLAASVGTSRRSAGTTRTTPAASVGQARRNTSASKEVDKDRGGSAAKQ